jgi:hypothetical protein
VAEKGFGDDSVNTLNTVDYPLKNPKIHHYQTRPKGEKLVEKLGHSLAS